MAKGVIYLMTTAVPGLIKIGKTTISNYSKRMYFLESNGYRNVVSMKRAFAIEVEGRKGDTFAYYICKKSCSRY